MNAVDLSKLPVPDVIETIDFEDLYESILARFRDALGSAWTASLESEPVVKVFEEFAYEHVMLRARVNAAARALLLASSKGADLDNVLALLDTKRLTDELDDDFRERGRLAPYGFSTAGPGNAYKFHALSAHPDIRDVWVDSPNPGDVRLTVLSRVGDGVPTAEVLAAVRAAVNAEDVRPLNDTVLVEPAQVAAWELRAVLHFASGAATEPVMQAAQDAAEAYAQAQHRINAPVSRNMVIAALGVVGVADVELLSPAGDVEERVQFAPFCTDITLEQVVDYE